LTEAQRLFTFIIFVLWWVVHLSHHSPGLILNSHVYAHQTEALAKFGDSVEAMRSLVLMSLFLIIAQLVWSCVDDLGRNDVGSFLSIIFSTLPQAKAERKLRASWSDQHAMTAGLLVFIGPGCAEQTVPDQRWIMGASSYNSSPGTTIGTYMNLLLEMLDRRNTPALLNPDQVPSEASAAGPRSGACTMFIDGIADGQPVVHRDWPC